MRQINQIVVHCAATKPSMDIGAEEICRWHTDPRPKGRGWSDIGYHFVIRRNGALENGRPIERMGAHAKGKNRQSIGICLVGGINNAGKEDANFTLAQYKSLENLLARLKQKFPDAGVIGHRNVSTKACPSFDVSTLVSCLDFNHE
jgi:N-acetylmuramoyl-L-alanine amidase